MLENLTRIAAEASARYGIAAGQLKVTPDAKDKQTLLVVEASERMQVILLTCRERAFRHVAAKRVRL